jgi:hypothetical protein
MMCFDVSWVDQTIGESRSLGKKYEPEPDCLYRRVLKCSVSPRQMPSGE